MVAPRLVPQPLLDELLVGVVPARPVLLERAKGGDVPVHGATAPLEGLVERLDVLVAALREVVEGDVGHVAWVRGHQLHRARAVARVRLEDEPRPVPLVAQRDPPVPWEVPLEGPRSSEDDDVCVLICDGRLQDVGYCAAVGGVHAL